MPFQIRPHRLHQFITYNVPEKHIELVTPHVEKDLHKATGEAHELADAIVEKSGLVNECVAGRDHGIALLTAMAASGDGLAEGPYG